MLTACKSTRKVILCANLVLHWHRGHLPVVPARSSRPADANVAQLLTSVCVFGSSDFRSGPSNEASIHLHEVTCQQACGPGGPARFCWITCICQCSQHAPVLDTPQQGPSLCCSLLNTSWVCWQDLSGLSGVARPLT